MNILQIEGKADDLYCVDKNGLIKSVSVTKLNSNDECDYDITLTSIKNDKDNCSHELIKSLLGHNIRFTVEIID
jgi:hypothetical protein